MLPGSEQLLFCSPPNSVRYPTLHRENTWDRGQKVLSGWNTFNFILDRAPFWNWACFFPLSCLTRHESDRVTARNIAKHCDISTQNSSKKGHLGKFPSLHVLKRMWSSCILLKCLQAHDDWKHSCINCLRLFLMVCLCGRIGVRGHSLTWKESCRWGWTIHLLSSLSGSEASQLSVPPACACSCCCSGRTNSFPGSVCGRKRQNQFPSIPQTNNSSGRLPTKQPNQFCTGLTCSR